MRESKDSKKAKTTSPVNIVVTNKAKNLRIKQKKGQTSKAIDSDLVASTISDIENPTRTLKYTFALINKLAREGSHKITEYLPEEPIKSNKLYRKYVISSTESFGGTKAFRALIQNGYFDQPKSLKDTVGYASEAFGRSYIPSDFGQVVKDLLKDGVIDLCTGPDAGVKYYIAVNPVKDKWQL